MMQMQQLSRRFIWQFVVRRSLHTTSIAPLPTDPRKHAITPNQEKEVKEIDIPVPWGHISGKWWGRTDVQPVLMLHGWQDNAGTFDTLAPLLNNEALLSVDLVGHGQSSHYPLGGQCYNFLDGIINIGRIIRYFGWEKVSIIGHSMGSIMAYAYAASFPKVIDKFVTLEDVRGALSFIVPPPVTETRRQVEANLSYESKLSDKELQQPWYTYDEILELCLVGYGDIVTRESAQILLRRGLVESPEGGQFRISRDPRLKLLSWNGAAQDDMYAYASQITCDNLNIRAKGSTSGRPKALAIYEKTLQIIEKKARCEYHVVDGTHHVHLNNPERVAPLINKFFEVGNDGGK